MAYNPGAEGHAKPPRESPRWISVLCTDHHGTYTTEFPRTDAGRRCEEEVAGRRILDVWARGARGAGRVAPGGRGLGAMRGRGGRGEKNKTIADFVVACSQ